MHPFVSGELACGNLKDRASILSDLQALPQSKPATSVEVLQLLEDRRLWGAWTLDARLAKAAAAELGVG